MTKTSRGFTLIELLVALAILSTLTVLSAQSIQQALQSKKKIQTQVDDMSQVRDALRIIEKDVNMAYHYRDIEEDFYAALKKSSSTSTQTTNQNPNNPNPPQNPSPTASDTKDQQRKANRVSPETHFEGNAEEMAFVTMNAGRIAETEVRADFIKVGYKVSPCKRISKKQESTKCLMRRMDSFVEGKVKEGGTNVVLLENVSEFKLRYFGKGKQDWGDTWSSGETGDTITKGNYPGAVEVSLTVENGEESAISKKRKISMQMVMPVRFPNNKEQKASTPSAGGP